MKQRYVAHCNVGTDIEQASFLGEQGEFIACGSHDGRWFIWEKRTGRLIKMLAVDGAAVNCVQPHPYDCAVSTIEIDNTVKLWTPNAKATSMVAGPEIDVLSAIENNQWKLSATVKFCCLSNFWNDFGCMSLLKEVYILWSVLRLDLLLLDLLRNCRSLEILGHP